MKKGFTLIELLAVIIILAVIALIATPIVLNVVNNARDSARKSSVAGFADATKLAITEYQFKEQGSVPVVDKSFVDKITYQGDKVVCGQDGENPGVYYSTSYGIVLHGCKVGDNDTLYYFGSGKVYTDKNDETYKKIFDSVKGNPTEPTKPVANAPELVDKLVPVVYDGTNWKVADIKTNWYDYDAKKWANAVILNNGVTKNTNDTLNLNTDVAQMYVWIPRYEYKLPTASIGTTGKPEPIEIKFIDKNKTTADSGYNLHPGFNFGGTNKSGIWIGKFETSTTDTTCLTNSTEANCNKEHSLKVLPNSDSLRYINVSNMFNSSRKVETEYAINADIHMSKYTEWTAVSYLTNSKYGRCTGNVCEEVRNNNVRLNTTTSNTKTGCAATTENEAVSTTCTNPYETAIGVLASTTGNITGVYDMSGGSWEYVMGYLTNANSNYTSNPNGYFGWANTTNYANFTSKPADKYFDAFTSSDITKNTYSVLQNVNGGTNFAGIFSELLSDKTATTSWNGDHAIFVYGTSPWFILGGGHSSSTGAGVFASNTSNGSSYYYYSFRLSLFAEK